MADLDDFFAKKDRKKSKGKKFATADEIAKKLEETGRRAEKLKKEKNQTSQLTTTDVDEQGNAVQVFRYILLLILSFLTLPYTISLFGIFHVYIIPLNVLMHYYKNYVF